MATTVGWPLGRFLFPNLAIFVIGLGLGILHWFILQHKIRKVWRWVLATAIVWTTGAAIILFLVQDGMEFFAGAVVGLTTGTAQWLVLRKEVNWPAWWIAISIIGWTTGMALLPGLILTGVMVGVITGIALELLLRYPKQLEPEDEDIHQLDWRK